MIRGERAFARWLDEITDFESETSGYDLPGSSRYYRVGELVIRVSDHRMPEYGGYSEERGERMGAADVSISSHPGKFDLPNTPQVWAALRKMVAEEIYRDDQ